MDLDSVSLLQGSCKTNPREFSREVRLVQLQEEIPTCNNSISNLRHNHVTIILLQVMIYLLYHLIGNHK